MINTELVKKIQEAKKQATAIVSSLDEDKHYFVSYLNNVPKKVLMKPGAELIANAMGLVGDISEAQILQSISGNLSQSSAVVRCKLMDAQGNMVSSGIGAYAISSCGMNTAAKMAAKSAFIDAVIRGTGISECFTQDVNELDAPAGGVAPVAHNPENKDSFDHEKEANEADDPEKLALIEWIMENTPNYEDVPAMHGVRDLSELSTQDLYSAKEDTIKVSFAIKDEEPDTSTIGLC